MTEAPFLRLPIELRFEIYRYLAPTQPFYTKLSLHHLKLLVPTAKIPKSQHPPVWKGHPAILRVNKLIYNEAITVWYQTLGLTVSLDFMTPRIRNHLATTFYRKMVPSHLFQNVRMLNITFDMEWFRVHPAENSGYIASPAATAIVAALITVEVPLKKCTIYINSRNTAIKRHVEGSRLPTRLIETIEQQVLRGLRWNLAPFKSLQDDGVPITFVLPCVAIDIYYLCAILAQYEVGHGHFRRSPSEFRAGVCLAFSAYFKPLGEDHGETYQDWHAMVTEQKYFDHAYHLR